MKHLSQYGWLAVAVAADDAITNEGGQRVNQTAPLARNNTGADAASGRRERNKIVVIERILDAARAAFLRNGMNDADLVKIAEQANVGRATLYRYFDGKDALLAALLDQDWDKQAVLFQRLADKPALDAAAITVWLDKLIRATAARLDSFPIYYAVGKERTMTDHLARQRRRLMAILSARFRGFSQPGSGALQRRDHVEAFLLLLQIEQFVAYAAASKDLEEVKFGIELLSDRLAARITAG